MLMSNRFTERNAASIVVGLIVTLVTVVVFQTLISGAFDSLLAALR